MKQLVLCSTFSKAKHGKPIILYGYHFSMNRNLKLNNTKLFYFGENKAWASPWMKSEKEYRVRVTFKNPYVLQNMSKQFEGPNTLATLNQIKIKGYDGVVFNSIVKNSPSQALAFYPVQSVKFV